MLRNKTFTFTFLTLGIVMLVAGCATSRTHTARQDMGPGFGDFGDFGGDTTEIAYEDAPAILPETYFAAAKLFEHQGLAQKAITQYRHAIGAKHDYVEAYHRLGQLLGKTGHHVEATEALTRAVHFDPESAVLRNDLGFQLALQQRWGEAEAQLRLAIELEPDFSRAHVNLGMVLGRQGRFEESLACFQTVLPVEDAYYNLGLMFRAKQHYAEAADAFAFVLRTNPQFTAASRQLEYIQPFLESTPHGTLAATVGDQESPGYGKDKAAADTPQRRRAFDNVACVKVACPDRDGITAKLLREDSNRRYVAPVATRVQTSETRVLKSPVSMSSTEKSATDKREPESMASTVVPQMPLCPMGMGQMAYITRMTAMGKQLFWTQDEISSLEQEKCDLQLTAEQAAAFDAEMLRRMRHRRLANPLAQDFQFNFDQPLPNGPEPAEWNYGIIYEPKTEEPKEASPK